ncbi:MAG: hypothetical protein N2235_03045 [Fischerella sp.]|nr:hypothetical protein [Fischerella sp.]
MRKQELLRIMRRTIWEPGKKRYWLLINEQWWVKHDMPELFVWRDLEACYKDFARDDLWLLLNRLLQLIHNSVRDRGGYWAVVEKQLLPLVYGY